MNFKHLHHFWATAKSGGVMRAGAQLHISPQTLSGQIKLLEERLGCALFRKRGRQLALTDSGQLVLDYADQIFGLSAELEAALRRHGQSSQTLDFRVGIADAVPKAIAYRLLEPALTATQPVRLICHEGKFQDLLAKLAVQRLDLVIADEPMDKQMNVRAFNHALGTTAMSFFGTPPLLAKLQGPFPNNLRDAPLLIQGHASAMRQRLEVWLNQHQIPVRIIGEFDDAALLSAFGREGRGLFMSPTVLEPEICAQYGVEVLGRTQDLVEEFYAVSVERRITHPCIAAITSAARDHLFRS